MADVVFANLVADSGNRILLPKYLSDRVPWLTKAKEQFFAWLYLLSSGRFRLLSDEEVSRDPTLEPVRALILESGAPPQTKPTEADEPTSDSVAVRLARVSLSLPSTGWRLTIPRTFEVFVPPECDTKAFSVLFSLEGYLEIWYTYVLQLSVCEEARRWSVAITDTSRISPRSSSRRAYQQIARGS